MVHNPRHNIKGQVTQQQYLHLSSELDGCVCYCPLCEPTKMLFVFLFILLGIKFHLDFYWNGGIPIVLTFTEYYIWLEVVI